MMDLRLAPDTKRAVLRVVTTFFDAADFVTCCFLTVACFADAALAGGTTKAANKAKHPANLRTRWKVRLSIVLSLARGCIKKHGWSVYKMKKSRNIKNLRDFPQNGMSC